jgi:ligand-binding sensor domain-containing protein
MITSSIVLSCDKNQSTAPTTGTNDHTKGWETLSTRNSPLPHDRITSIVIDAQDRKWIGTYGGGLAMYDDSDWYVFEQLQPDIPVKYINSLAFDFFNVLWIGTDGDGLIRFDGISWQQLNTNNSELVNDYITVITVDQLNRKWICTRTGITLFDGNTWTHYSTENTDMPEDHITALAIDTYGSNWIGTTSGFFLKFNSNTLQVYDKNHSNILGEQVNDICIDDFDNKWTGTEIGLAKYDNNIWTEFPIDGIRLDGPVQCIAVDDTNVWIGTKYDPDLSQYQGGLVHYDGEEWTLYKKNNSGLPDNNISVIKFDQDNKMWIGTTYGGIGIYDTDIVR